MFLLGGSAAAGYSSGESSATLFDRSLDRDGNGVEDALDAWRRGESEWSDLRARAVGGKERLLAMEKAGRAESGALKGLDGPWARGQLRVLCLGTGAARLADARARAEAGGECGLVRRVAALDAAVVACDEAGLRAFLDADPGGRILLDRDGVPALDTSVPLIGAGQLRGPGWSLGRDWSSTVAVLDSGCDTAHGDLGDDDDDNADGPAPRVGDTSDWYPADYGWPLFAGYRVVGWTDVSDDFPEAVGPWDYHHHGTALASVVAGSGVVDPALAGVAPGTRLTVVKFYDFDLTWHAWAGDFLAACAWVLEHHETYRIRTVLAAVNWDVDAGLSDAVAALTGLGIVTVAAMGNHGDDATAAGFPALLPDVLTVGGVNDAAAVAAFSGRGPTGAGKPDLLAPSGGQLAAAGRITAADNEPNDTYSERVGTSLAAAHAAGAVALLDEALIDRGLALPRDRESVLTRLHVLKTTSALVNTAETNDGQGTTALAPWDGPDETRGWGLLRVDAAVEAMVEPLRPGVDQLADLSADWSRPVAGRRLVIEPDVRYLVEAVPTAGLDIVLEIVDPVGATSGLGDASTRRDDSGPGVSEFVYVRAEETHWLMAAIKRKSGSGSVTLRLREADTFTAQGYSRQLPGLLTGAPNQGRVLITDEPSQVIPTRVRIDDASRALSVLAPDGSDRPGWPVLVFPHVSAQGGLNLPLVWDLDGAPGDEIVATSAYGTVYFFSGNGAYVAVDLDFNVALTPAVGLEGAAERRVAALDEDGAARVWAQGPVQRAFRDFGHGAPLDPAAGVLDQSGAESLVLAFADGHLAVVDENLADRPGWPRNLGVTLETAPVLADFDGDGDLEIVQPVRDDVSGLLTMRVFEGDGDAGVGDGTTVLAPGGGRWLATGSALVTGRTGGPDFGVTLLGLTDNGLTGADAGWTLSYGTLRTDGSAVSASFPGLSIAATTNEGVLVLDHLLLPAPVAWDVLDGAGTEAVALASIGWTELLYGLTAIPGGVTAWYRPEASGRPLPGWLPRERGGPEAVAPGPAATLLLTGQDGPHLRVDVLDDVLSATPVLAGGGGPVTWNAARGDGRNSGSRAPGAGLSPVVVGPGSSRLTVFPNPGAGRFHFRLDGAADPVPTRVEIYDLRGRRVRSLRAAPGEAPVWDGRGTDGRPLATGAYLAVVRLAARTHTTRIILTR